MWCLLLLLLLLLSATHVHQAPLPPPPPLLLLTCSWWAVEQHAAWWVNAQLPVQVTLCEWQLNSLTDLLLLDVIATNVLWVFDLEGGQNTSGQGTLIRSAIQTHPKQSKDLARQHTLLHRPWMCV